MTSRAYRDRHFTQEEVGELIELAARLQAATEAERSRLRDGISYDELVAIAGELDVAEDDLVRAITRSRLGGPVETGTERSRARRLYRRAVARLKAMLVLWGGLSAGLMVIDAAERVPGAPLLEWAWYPIAGVGIGVAVRAAKVVTARQRLDEVA